MPLDLCEADLVGAARNGADGDASQRVDAQDPMFDLMLKVLHRDDPARRSYLQRRWQGHPASIPLSTRDGPYDFKRTYLPPIGLSRRLTGSL
jgi:hypothetical protein